MKKALIVIAIIAVIALLTWLGIRMYRNNKEKKAAEALENQEVPADTLIDTVANYGAPGAQPGANANMGTGQKPVQ